MIQEKNILKMYFKTGDKPTQIQYENLIDSLRHMHDKIPLDNLNLEGYDEEGTRENGVITRLGDFNNSNNGTKIIIDDTNKEVTIKGSITEVNGNFRVNGTESTVSNSFNSQLHVTDTITNTGINIVSFTDAVKTSASTTDIFYGNMNRVIYSGASDINETAGGYNIGRYTGSGNINSLSGTISLASYRGTGNVDNAIFASFNKAEIENYGGTPTIDYTIGLHTKSEVSHPGATLNHLYGTLSELDLKEGTITNAYVQALDIDYNSATADINLTNLYYILAKSSELPAVTGEAYFIKSDVPLPSKLSGDLEITNNNVNFHELQSDWNTDANGSTATYRSNVGTWRLWSGLYGGEVFKVDMSTRQTTFNAQVTATNFSGNWNGKTESDFVSTTGTQTINGYKIFNDTVRLKNGTGIIGSSSGTENAASFTFYESDNTTRQGWLGFGSITASDLSLHNDISLGHLKLAQDGKLYYNNSEILDKGNHIAGTDYVSISEDETISGKKTFSDDIDIVYNKIKFYTDPVASGNPGAGFSSVLEGSITGVNGEGLQIDTSLKVNSNITSDGDIRTNGNYISSDGSTGYTGTYISGVNEITVKNGIITNIVNIS